MQKPFPAFPSDLSLTRNPFRRNTAGFMTVAVLISGKTRYAIVIAVILVLAICAACRKRGNSHDANRDASASIAGTEQGRQQANALVEQARELYRNDEDEKAEEILKQAVGLDPNNAEAHLRLGMSYAALGKKTESEEEYKKAVELYKKKVQDDPDDGTAFFYLGEAHNFLHQDEAAVRAYRQATKLKPEDEEAWYQLGMAETKLAHYPEATSAFQKALELDPNDYRAADGLDNAKEGAQRIREGKKHNEEMLKKQQENANANANSNSGSPVPRRSP
jgi:tetratricopeptide (TPR) repeat protein